jgi:hypothetical protein
MANQSGWWSLLAIYQADAEELRQQRNRRPAACPNDGEPLQSTPDGSGLFCPYDGWRWDGIGAP